MFKGWNVTIPQTPPPEHLTYRIPAESKKLTINGLYLLSTPIGVQGLVFPRQKQINYWFPMAESEIIK